MSNFIQKIKEKYQTTNIDEIKEIVLTSIVIYFYSDIQFVIFKRHIENKMDKELSDEDLIEMISLISPKRKDNSSFYDTNKLTTDDRRRIYSDISILTKFLDYNFINDNMIPGITDSINELKKYDFKSISNKASCIENIKTSISLINIGLKDYINNHMNEITDNKINIYK